MPELSQEVLSLKLLGGLPTGTASTTPGEVRPALLDIPNVGKARIYLWTTTHIESPDRPADEFKIQMIVPGQGRRDRGQLEFSSKRSTHLLGYSADFGVFSGWQAELHEKFGYSSAVQVKEDLLEQARAGGWAVAKPKKKTGEVIVAFSPANLALFLESANAADAKGLSGDDREAWMLAATPNLDTGKLPKKAAAAVQTLRTRLLTSRLSRDQKFGRLVQRQYRHACAVCGIALNVVEGAHIINVHEEGSVDEIWNGIALCRNHHKLFDANTLVISPSLIVRVDHAAVALLKACGRHGGVKATLLAYEKKKIREPLDFKTSKKMMLEALARREQRVALK